MGAAKEHLGSESLKGIALQLLRQPVERGGEIWAHCPWHQESTPGGAFSYSAESDVAYCHSCQGKGDIIDLFATANNMEQSQAFVEFMREHCPSALDRSTGTRSRFKRTPKMPEQGKTSTDWSPQDLHRPPQIWREKANKVMNWGSEQLQQAPDVAEWLRKRGISEATAYIFGLGWIPQDIYRERESWGVPAEYHKDGREKKLWIPRGLVIPYLRKGELQRLRFRRFQDDQLPRYYVLHGSGRAPMWIQCTVSQPTHEAVMVVEAELDGIMLHEQAGDLVHVLALGSSSAKPNDPDVLASLDSAVSILLSLDFDQAGQKATAWWQERYSAAEYWPVPEGKDPGDAYQAGINIREWILDGLPPVFHVDPGTAPQKEELSSSWTNGPCSFGEQCEEGEDAANASSKEGKPNEATEMESDTSRFVPESINEFSRLLASYPVRIQVSEKGVRILENPKDALRFWEQSRRISELVFQNDEVWQHLHELAWFGVTLIDSKNILGD